MQQAWPGDSSPRDRLRAVFKVWVTWAGQSGEWSQAILTKRRLNCSQNLATWPVLLSVSATLDFGQFDVVLMDLAISEGLQRCFVIWEINGERRSASLPWRMLPRMPVTFVTILTKPQSY